MHLRAVSWCGVNTHTRAWQPGAARVCHRSPSTFYSPKKGRPKNSTVRDPCKGIAGSSRRAQKLVGGGGRRFSVRSPPQPVCRRFFCFFHAVLWNPHAFVCNIPSWTSWWLCGGDVHGGWVFTLVLFPPNVDSVARPYNSASTMSRSNHSQASGAVELPITHHAARGPTKSGSNRSAKDTLPPPPPAPAVTTGPARPVIMAHHDASFGFNVDEEVRPLHTALDVDPSPHAPGCGLA
jgi:hypothetical protein